MCSYKVITVQAEKGEEWLTGNYTVLYLYISTVSSAIYKGGSYFQKCFHNFQIEGLSVVP